jgi:hypothetical protein
MESLLGSQKRYSFASSASKTANHAASLAFVSGAIRELFLLINVYVAGG